LSFWVCYLIFDYFEGQLSIDYLFVFFFLRVYICIVYVYCLLLCLYLFLKVFCLSIYLFTSFRVKACVYFWKLVCVFVFERLNENVSLWGQLDQAFDLLSMLKHVRWKEHGIVWYKKSYLIKQIVILIHACWLDIRMSSYN